MDDLEAKIRELEEQLSKEIGSEGSRVLLEGER
jgi:hypothetical protein